MKRSITDLEQDLDDQLTLLKNACSSYDNGSIVEYKNIASRIRVLVHDTNQSTSLLKLIGQKDTVRFIDTCLPYIINTIKTAWYGLILRHSSFIECRPIFNEFPRSKTEVSFDQWWTKPVLEDMKDNKLTRKDIVLSVANKDGGSHIQEELDEDKEKAYIAMAFKNSLGLMASKDRGIEWEESVAIPATIRQIAEELIITLDPSYSPSQGEYTQENGIMIAGMKIGLVGEKKMKIGRNDPCPCGSGRKYKKCCLNKNF